LTCGGVGAGAGDGGWICCWEEYRRESAGRELRFAAASRGRRRATVLPLYSFTLSVEVVAGFVDRVVRLDALPISVEGGLGRRSGCLSGDEGEDAGAGGGGGGCSTIFFPSSIDAGGTMGS
jgi:hypothetical protein